MDMAAIIDSTKLTTEHRITLNFARCYNIQQSYDNMVNHLKIKTFCHVCANITVSISLQGNFFDALTLLWISQSYASMYIRFINTNKIQVRYGTCLYVYANLWCKICCNTSIQVTNRFTVFFYSFNGCFLVVVINSLPWDII